MNLPPLGLLERWRSEGLSPQEIYTRCEETNEARRKDLGQAAAKKIGASKRESARLEREQKRRQEAEQIRSLREQNKTWVEISQALGRSFEYLRRLAQEAEINIKIKHKSLRRSRKLPSNEELTRLIQVKTAKEISELYKVTPEAVYKSLDRAGIPRRRYKPRGKATQ